MKNCYACHASRVASAPIGAVMRFKVAISLVAAICLGSAAMASSHPEEQMVNGKGARDRSSGGGSSGAERRNGGDGGGTATRGNGGERTATESRRDNGG